MRSDPIKVAIVGGGCAGLAAAWELSKLPDYQVDVYEKSWRLGGKGASGRNRRPSGGLRRGRRADLPSGRRAHRGALPHRRPLS